MNFLQTVIAAAGFAEMSPGEGAGFFEPLFRALICCGLTGTAVGLVCWLWIYRREIRQYQLPRVSYVMFVIAAAFGFLFGILFSPLIFPLLDFTFGLMPT